MSTTSGNRGRPTTTKKMDAMDMHAENRPSGGATPLSARNSKAGQGRSAGGGLSSVLSPINARLKRRSSKKSLVTAAERDDLISTRCESPANRTQLPSATQNASVLPSPSPSPSEHPLRPTRSASAAAADEITTKNPLQLLLQNVHQSTDSGLAAALASPRRAAAVAATGTPTSSLASTPGAAGSTPVLGGAAAVAAASETLASPIVAAAAGSPSGANKRKGTSTPTRTAAGVPKRSRLDAVLPRRWRTEAALSTPEPASPAAAAVVAAAAAAASLSSSSSSSSVPCEGGDGAISKPFNVVHCTHVGKDLQWTSMVPDKEMFHLEEKLGEGAFGVVYRATYDSGYPLVVKEVMAGLESEESLKKEIEILKSCRHANIVQYFGSCLRGDKFWILMEYCAGGSLRDTIETRQATLSESQMACAAFSVIKGLIYLHSRSIIHRDIKAANILLNDHAEVKLADFGVSEQLSRKKGRDNVEIIGTPLWMAPEVARAQQRGGFDNNSVEFHRKADVWALGITMIELADGLPPFVEMSLWAALQKIAQLTTSPTLANPASRSAQLNDFIAACLVVDPDRRPFVHELLAHPFVARAMTIDPAQALLPLVAETLAAKKQAAQAELAAASTGASDWVISQVPDPSASGATAGAASAAGAAPGGTHCALDGPAAAALLAMDCSTAVVNMDAEGGTGEYSVLLQADGAQLPAPKDGDDDLVANFPEVLSPPKSATVLLSRYF